MNPGLPLTEPEGLHDRQRVPAALLILLELVALGWQSQLWAFSAIAAVITLSAVLLPNLRPRVSFDLQIRLGIGLVLLIYLWHRFLPPEFSYNRNFLGTSPVACSSARCLIALQVLQLAVRRTPDRLPALFCGMGVAAMVFAFDVTARPSERAGVQALAVGFVFLSGLFFAASRRPAPNDSGTSLGRRLAILILLAVTGSTAWGASALLQER
ncbi:MAG: hypothetical protein KDA79_20450 [Planctomycetaceae bacterium]|nr:hypothetical protein [Planctomycetaceae bacterium]